MQSYQWIFELKKETSSFLGHMKGKKRPGFFKYSYSGDYFTERIHWGLGQSAFFLKIVYTLNLQEQFKKEIKEAQTYIETFRHGSGLYFDSLVCVLSFPKNVFNGLRYRDWNHAVGMYTKLGETRQAVSSLLLFDQNIISKYPTSLPRDEKDIERYLSKLHWTRPWHAGAHYSILVFFLHTSELKNKEILIDTAQNWLKNVAQKDGFWYAEGASLQERINGAMKVITGMNVLGKVTLHNPEGLIDICLESQHNEQACDNFNILYVLKYANLATERGYRHKEILSFVENRLGLYKKYYYKDKGGFSFFENKANTRYYGARLSRGYEEPDMHGTVLFLWGISIIAQILDIEKELNIREFRA